jgi:hypothetical protein
MIITTTIYDDDDQPIEITAEYSQPCRGSRDKYGAQMEPDTESDIVILESLDANGDSITLTKRQEARASDKLWEVIAES